MKDYSTVDNNFVFITNYSVQDEVINIIYANGDKRVVPYTERNIEIIENRMAEQVQYALGKKETSRYLYLSLGISGIAFLTAVNLFLNNQLSPTLLWPINGGLTAMTGFSFTTYGIKKSKIEELKKLKYFLENRIRLNKSIKEPNISAGLSNKKQEFINKTQGNVFSFETIDGFSYNDMLIINDNIKREESLDFDYPTLSKTK